MGGKVSNFGKRGPAAAMRAPVARALAAAAPEPVVASPVLPRFLRRLPWLTVTLCLVLSWLFNNELHNATDFAAPNAPGHFTLLALGAASRAQVVGAGEWWRLFTAPILHGSLEHLVSNLTVLIVAGFLLEPMVGTGWFAAIYFAGALGGVTASMMLNPADLPTVGASGAIMACLAALLCLSFHAEAKRVVMTRWVVGFLLFPALAPSVHDGVSVDISAHLGGLVVGTALAYFLLLAWPEEESDPPGRKPAAWAGGVLAGVTVLCFALSWNAYGRYAGQGLDYIPPAEMPQTADAMQSHSFGLVEKYPKDPRSHFFRGLYFLGIHDEADAETPLRDAVRLDEENPIMSPRFLTWARALLARDVEQLGRKEEALKIAAPVCNQADGPALQALQEGALCPPP